MHVKLMTNYTFWGIYILFNACGIKYDEVFQSSSFNIHQLI